MSFCEIREHDGWLGAFTRAQAEGALPNGTRIVKQCSEEGDGHPDGTRGFVLGSVSHHEIQNGVIFYFIEWETQPRVAVGTIAFKVREVTGER